MHPLTTTSPSAGTKPEGHPSSPASLSRLLDQITQLLNQLLHSSLSVTSFSSRWQIIRAKLLTLRSMVCEVSDSAHWSENLLLQTLLPNLLSTLRRVETLRHQCSDPSLTPGKLLMQSDLDMSANWLAKLIHDLDLLLRSGVLRQSTAIVLSQPAANACKDDLRIFVKDLFIRLQIGGVEFKKKALDSLIQLLAEDEKSAGLVAKEGDVTYLLSLLDINVNSFVREQAIYAVSLLASNSECSRKCLFEEGALGPLLRIVESSSMPLKEKAALAVESITSDPDNSWAISAYGGVPILIELCKSGSAVAQSHAVGALKNVLTNEDIRLTFGEEGVIPVLLQLLVSDTASVQEKAANCVAILSSASEYFKNLLIQEKGLQRLLHCLQDSSSSDTLEHALRAIYYLSDVDSAFRMLSSSTAFVIQIAELIKHGNIMLQHICASLLAKLSLSEGNKRAISGCIGTLVKLMESAKPEGIQEVAANALVSLLAVRSNQKEFIRDEKSVMRLTQMLDLRFDSVSKKFPIAVVLAITAGGSQGCRKGLIAAGVHGHLQKLLEMEVAGAKKALQRLSGSRLKSIFSRTWRVNE